MMQEKSVVQLKKIERMDAKSDSRIWDRMGRFL